MCVPTPISFYSKETALMFRVAMAATLGVVLSAGSANSQTLAQVDAQIKSVKAQIRGLDNEQRKLVRQMEAKYNPRINRIGGADDYEKRERARLGREEADALNIVTDPAARKQIRIDFDKKRAQLLVKIKHKNAEIRKLKKERDQAIAGIKNSIKQQKQGPLATLKQLETQRQKLQPNKDKNKDKKKDKKKPKNKPKNKPKPKPNKKDKKK
jgi:hypothetical protein